MAAACAPEIPRDEVPRRVIALFDPAAVTPVVPLPNDLAFDPATGLLLIPDAASASLAQKEFNAWLRTLDGFPISARPSLTFSGRLDAASVKPEAVQVLDITNEAAPIEVPNISVSYTPEKNQLTIDAKLQRAHSYLVAVLGTEAGGLRGSAGEDVIGSAAFVLLRARKSLVTCLDLAATDCSSTTELLDSSQKAITLERARRKLQSGLVLLEGKGLKREQLAAAWSFTTASQPLATFDPANSVVPFPNELLMEAGLVNLPPDVKDDALSAALKVQLNTLDGFSTSASITSESGELVGAADVRLDFSSVTAAQFRFVNLEDLSEVVPFTLNCRACGLAGTPPGAEPDQVSLTPNKPLRSHTRYGVFWLKGAKSLEGKPLNANSVFALARSRNPLFANNHSTIDSVEDLDAALVETLRLKLAPTMVAADTAGIARENLVLAWTFTTQTTAPGLVTMRNKPVEWNLSTGVIGGPANLVPIDTSPLVTFGAFVGQDLSSNIRWVKEGEFSSAQAFDPNGVETNFATMATTPTDGAFTPALLITPRPENRRFILIVPTTPRFADGRIPVVFFHHGLGQSRRDAAAIANTIAKAGYATLAIDAPFHGLRSYCQKNSDCRAGTACTKHRCPDALTNPNDGYAVRALPPFGNDPLETPNISGDQFISPSNLFASRDHFRQQVIDYAQMVRVLNDATAGIGAIDVDNPATAGVVERLDPANPRYIGMSLGGIIGTLITAAIPELTASTLNVPGASMTDVILESSSFSSQRAPLDTYLGKKGWPPGSQGYLRFLDLARWVLDPADPQSCGRHLIAEPLGSSPKKKVFISWVKNDETIPNSATELLLRSIDVPAANAALFKNFQYPSGGHAFLLNIGSVASAALAIQAQNEAVDWVKP